MTRTLFLLFISALLLSSCTTAKESGPSDTVPQPSATHPTDYIAKQERLTFKDYDTNNDNRISIDEYIKKQGEAFDRIDKTNTGEVDTEEILVYWCSQTTLKKGTLDPTMAPIYRDMDKDGNGNVTTEECRAYWITRLKENKLDNNNRINRSQYDSLMRDRYRNLLDGPDQDGHITNQDYDSFFYR